MPIDRIYIKNFKSIRDSGEINIRPLNVLIGSNVVQIPVSLADLQHLVPGDTVEIVFEAFQAKVLLAGGES